MKYQHKNQTTKNKSTKEQEWEYEGARTRAQRSKIRAPKNKRAKEHEWEHQVRYLPFKK
jgi:hypothetical protein